MMVSSVFFIDNGHTCIYFDEGKFDKYCVYINGRGKFRYAPTDDVYFTWIKNLAYTYGVTQVWDDFCEVYDIVDTGENNREVFALVNDIDMHYNDDTVLWWLIFYMTMLAECKKENTILKKGIKKLGVYNVLIDEWDIEYVITYMRGKNWRTLNELMEERGI